MEVITKTTIDMLTSESVSILTQKYVTIDGVDTQVGDNHRKAYVNSKAGREELQSEHTADVVNAVFAIWGNEPTIEEQGAL